MMPVIADKETSGKTFWARFKEEQKGFEERIYLNENVDDFKMYFREREKDQDGDLHRKVLLDLDDYQGLKYWIRKMKLEQQNKKDAETTERT